VLYSLRLPSMKPPSLEEVDAYCQKFHPEVDAVAFWNHYQAKANEKTGAWRIGRDPMTNWHCAVATWSRKLKERIVSQKPVQCLRCGDNGTLPNHEICSCPRGSEAKQARIVMARIKATVSQLGRSYDFPSTAAPKGRRVELQNQAQLFLEASPKAAYSPTQDFQARREQLKAQAQQVRK
jgi:hypothetical protein